MTDFNKKLLRTLSSHEWDKALVLLDNGADPTVRNKMGYNALLLLADGAAFEVDQPILQQLADICLEKGCLLSDAARDGNTVMHLCARNTGLFTHLLKYNPYCGSLNKEKKNILYFAARSHNITASSLSKCIALGADIDYKDNHGNNAFDYFTRFSFHGAHHLLFLIEHGYEPTGAQIFDGCLVALRENTTDNDMLSYLNYAHQKNVDFNKVDYSRVPLLAQAVCSGRIQAVEYLLNHGASIERSETGQPLGMALNAFDHKKMLMLMELLVKHGLNVNSTGAHSSQQTMLHQLMYHLPLPVGERFNADHAKDVIARLRTVLQYGGDLNQPEELNMTPLSIGLCKLTDEYPNVFHLNSDVQQYVNDILDVILEYGCDLNQTVGNGSGKTDSLGTLLRRCELTDLLEHKIAKKQHARILIELDNNISKRVKKI